MINRYRIMFKSHKMKPNHRVLRINEVDAYGAPVFAPDLAPLFLQPKCTNSNEHSMYIRYLWVKPSPDMRFETGKAKCCLEFWTKLIISICSFFN